MRDRDDHGDRADRDRADRTRADHPRGDRGGTPGTGRSEFTDGGSDYRTGGTDWMGGTMGDSGTASPAAPRARRGPKNWTRSDERIRDDLCERLSHMHDIDASDVSVTVDQGHVRLEGTVPERRMKHRIEDVADACGGVQDVQNLLRVARHATGIFGVPVGSNGLTGPDHMRRFSEMPMSEMGSVEPLRAAQRTDSNAHRSNRGGLLSRLFGFDTGSRVRDVMTRDPQVVSPQSTVQQAAALMKQLDVGVVPVCDGQRLQGMVTDRDIALRAVAEGKAPDTTPVSDVMTRQVHWCYEDEAIDTVLDKMGGLQIRRIPVIERDTQRLVGIVSLGDLAVEDRGDVDEALQQISQPDR